MKEDMSDHDLLIIIANDSKWIKEWAIKHEKEDAIVGTKIEAIAKAAHIRIDKVNERFNWLLISGVLSIVVFSITILIKH